MGSSLRSDEVSSTEGTRQLIQLHCNTKALKRTDTAIQALPLTEWWGDDLPLEAYEEHELWQCKIRTLTGGKQLQIEETKSRNVTLEGSIGLL